MNSNTLHAVEILLVEDSPTDIDLMKEAMEETKIHNGLNIVTDGVAALDFLHKRGPYADAPTPDLILLDLNLPRKDGREVLAEVKEDPKLKLIPVVVLTSSEAEMDIVRSYELHANCYVTKPLDLGQFFEIVKHIDEFWFSVVKLPPH